MVHYKIKTFAVLCDLLGENFDVLAEENTIDSLKLALIKRNINTEKILEYSRFVVDNQFVSGDYKFIDGQLIMIMPPSSGG